MSKFTIPDKVLYVCTGSKCGKRGGKDLFKMAKAYAKHNNKEEIEVIRIECTDRCDYAPVCTIQPGNIWIKEFKERDVLKKLDLI